MDLNRIKKLLHSVKGKKLPINKIKDKECLSYLLKNGYAAKKVEVDETISSDSDVKVPKYAKKFKFLRKRYGLSVEKTDNSFVTITRRGELKLRFKDKEVKEPEVKPKPESEAEDERED